MTVSELIKILNMIPADQRDREVRLWLPGSQLTIGGYAAFERTTAPDGKDLPKPIFCIEGDLVEGSALRL